ncbi:aminotransferase class I/II-fold pyridoxal phosphate-dependent enzyme [Nesterenkonia flava]|uniref:Aminotransferase class I/II-fold pyridoxal phosphate-dependent enzyme n=1 Tax=Nesterenkonia flava TaxID=469799 RepID=A0ABU1FUU4_9MICC|nr:aminotransferase class I/II-fold pyridoxal phosphate-dependent enzyme [Nesterenkonia flava]MDR5712388.1 aminotransferase class I/II-fold pyridoxal phosphate-dependent enzyme [Nesterenkonia flava]
MTTTPPPRPYPEMPWARTAAGANTYDAETGSVLPTIYERTTAGALAHQALNLGQGFPDAQGPDWLLEAAAHSITHHEIGPPNQYAPGLGIPALREAVAEHYRRRSGLVLDPETQIMATTGATEAIAATILAWARPGSEVVAFAPFYDSYGACVALAGARLRTVPLRAPDYRPDLKALETALTPNTSMILMNTPHNPTGTVFSREELARILHLAAERDIVVMCDEVYEHLIFDDASHTHSPILTVPGAENVALAVGSAGKSFSVTGWKVGWLTGSAKLVNRVRGVKQFLSFSSGPAFQWAVAQGLQDDQGFFAENVATLKKGRDLLHSGLERAGLRAHSPDAGYFVVADVSGVSEHSAEAFCAELLTHAGVAAIPVSSLISAETPAEDPLRKLVRFAFCKDHSTLEEAVERIVRFTE